MPTRGVIASVVRTLVYGGIGLFYVSSSATSESTNAILLGAVFADYSTWAFRTLFLLPGNVMRGCYEACINALFGWLVFRPTLNETTLESEALAVAFIAFLAVLGIKATYYAAAYFSGETAEDTVWPSPTAGVAGDPEDAVCSLDTAEPSPGHPAANFVNLLLRDMVENKRTTLTILRSAPLPEVQGLDNTTPPADAESILNRLKVLAGLNPAMYREPVEGYFFFDAQGRRFAARTRFEDSNDDSVCVITIQDKTILP